MKLYNEKELKYSRIFFEKKPPSFITYFVIGVFVSIVVGLAIITTVHKTYVVKAQGTITSSDNTYVSALTNATITELLKKEGDYVVKGETIALLSNGVEGVNTTSLSEQLNRLKERIAIMDAYEKSLNHGYNYMTNAGLEQEYYGKVEYYLQTLQSEGYNTSNTNQDIKKKESEITTLQQTITNLQTSQSALDVSNYESRRTTLQDEIDALTTSGDSEGAKQKQKELTKLESDKTQFDTLKSDMESKQTEVTNKQQEIQQLYQQKNNPQTQSGQMYAQMISELGTARSNNESKIQEIEGQLNNYKAQDGVLHLVAVNDGYLHYLSDVKVGMSVQANQVLVEVSKNETQTFYVSAYVQAQDISKIKEKQEVNVALVGVNTSKYGTLKGTVTNIDDGTTIQQTEQGNIPLYKIEIALHDTKLTSRDASIQAMKSMPVEARIVYDKETYLDWLLEQLNFKN